MGHLTSLRSRLGGRVINRSRTVSGLTTTIHENEIRVDPHGEPRSFVFIKPANINGARLIGRLTVCLFSSPRDLVELSVDRCVRGFDISEVVNSPPNCIKCSRTNRLARGMEEGPCDIVLFSRVRGTRGSILGVLLRVLSRNEVASSRNEAIGFRGAVVIVASGTNSASATSLNFNGSSGSVGGSIAVGTLRHFLHPRFLNEISRVVAFGGLAFRSFRGVTHVVLSRLIRDLGSGTVRLICSSSIPMFVTGRTFNSGGGTHKVHSYIHESIRSLLTSRVIFGRSERVGHFTLATGRGVRIDVSWVWGDA